MGMCYSRKPVLDGIVAALPPVDPVQIMKGLSPVYLHIYDLLVLNYTTSNIGVGVYHTGVQVYHDEYCFSGHNQLDGQTGEEITGLRAFRPPTDTSWIEDAIYKESIIVGYTRLTEAQVEEVYEEMKLDFVGPSYNVLARNCNHFTAAFIERLLQLPKGEGEKLIPPYVHRVVKVAQKVRPCLPSILTEDLRTQLPPKFLQRAAGSKGQGLSVPQRNYGIGHHIEAAGAGASQSDGTISGSQTHREFRMAAPDKATVKAELLEERRRVAARLKKQQDALQQSVERLQQSGEFLMSPQSAGSNNGSATARNAPKSARGSNGANNGGLSSRAPPPQRSPPPPQHQRTPSEIRVVLNSSSSDDNEGGSSSDDDANSRSAQRRALNRRQNSRPDPRQSPPSRQAPKRPTPSPGSSGEGAVSSSQNGQLSNRSRPQEDYDSLGEYVPFDHDAAVSIREALEANEHLHEQQAATLAMGAAFTPRRNPRDSLEAPGSSRNRHNRSPSSRVDLYSTYSPATPDLAGMTPSQIEADRRAAAELERAKYWKTPEELAYESALAQGVNVQLHHRASSGGGGNSRRQSLSQAGLPGFDREPSGGHSRRQSIQGSPQSIAGSPDGAGGRTSRRGSFSAQVGTLPLSARGDRRDSIQPHHSPDAGGHGRRQSFSQQNGGLPVLPPDSARRQSMSQQQPPSSSPDGRRASFSQQIGGIPLLPSASSGNGSDSARRQSIDARRQSFTAANGGLLLVPDSGRRQSFAQSNNLPNGSPQTARSSSHESYQQRRSSVSQQQQESKISPFLMNPSTSGGDRNGSLSQRGPAPKRSPSGIPLVSSTSSSGYNGSQTARGGW